MLSILVLSSFLVGVYSFPVQIRKSSLLPWKDDEPELGFCVERCDKEEGLLEVCIGVLDAGNGASEQLDNLQLSFPEQGPGGGLSSQLWPSAIASSIILRSPEFRHLSRDKDILELGCGVGLAGLVAAEKSASCVLTDIDEEAVKLLERTFGLNQGSLQADLSSKQMDWRDDHSGEDPVDILLGADIAYYYYLLRPIMDTSRAFMKKNDSLLLFIGQANRESQWDLYKNFRDGCYNQLTDEHEGPWPGETKMLLFNLKMSEWVDTIEDCDLRTDGVVPISVILNHPLGLADISLFKDFEHSATQLDDESIMKSF